MSTQADILAKVDELRALVLTLGTTPAPTPTPTPVPPPAHLKPWQTLWMSIDAFDELTDADFVSLRDDWGCTDLVAQFGYVRGYGGSQSFTTDKSATFSVIDGRSTSAWSQCRKVKYGNAGEGAVGNGNIVDRLHKLGMRIYHGFRWRSLPNRATPLAPWHDAAAWTALVDPKGPWAERIAYAKAWGFDGLAVDDEILNDGKTPEPTWRWDYAGHPYDELTTRASVFGRGAMFGRMLAAIWPGVEVIEYVTTGHAGFPDDWDDNVRQPAAGRINVKEPLVERDWWDGIFSVPAFTGSLSVLNVFYRGPGNLATWGEAIKSNRDTQLARMAQWRSWSRAKGRVNINAFIWPGRAQSAGEDKPLTAAEMAKGFTAARAYHMGRVGVYSQSITADRAYFSADMLAVLRG